METLFDVAQNEIIAEDDDSTGVEAEDVVGETIKKPFDPTKIRVDSKPMTIDLLLSRIRDNALDLNPDFQRKEGIWTDVAQSRLIESLLIRIPIPAFYIDATDEEHWLVVDGLQRLTTLKRFVITKKLKLCGLEFLTNLHGNTYDELSPKFQRRILETLVTVYLIAEGTPPNVKFNIFRRINTGGLPLSAQEIRHALNQGDQGKVTKFLTRLANSKDFKIAHDESIKDKRMADQECVLRFIAFTLVPYTSYSGDLDGFLNDVMQQVNNLPDSKIDELEQKFLKAIRTAYNIFGKDAFRKRYNRNNRRSLINKALFEAWSVNLGQLDEEQTQILIERKETLVDKFIALMNTTDFNDSVSQGTGDIKKVRTRFSSIERIIKEVLSS